MPQILRQFWITENGNPAENIEGNSCFGIFNLRNKLKKLRTAKPESQWSFMRGDIFQVWDNGRTRNIDE